MIAFTVSRLDSIVVDAAPDYRRVTVEVVRGGFIPKLSGKTEEFECDRTRASNWRWGY